MNTRASPPSSFPCTEIRWPAPLTQASARGEGVSLAELIAVLLAGWKPVAAAMAGVGLLALAATFLIAPVYTARVALMPPQQPQSSAASALSSLGALAGLAGAGVVKSPADQYVALLQSVTAANVIIDRFGLMEVYDRRLRIDAQKDLSGNVRVAAGKRDGLITVEVDDVDPDRSAAIANAHVDVLRSLTNTLAVSEAQQRRLFFEQQLDQTKDRLTRAQVALQGSGFDGGALKAEPKAAAEGYARLRAEVTAGEVRLQALKGMLADNAPEITQLQASLGALRRQVASFEAGSPQAQARGRGSDADYIGRYREYKYQETLFELFARQYELARVDESREGALIQVLDPATPPERKSRPRRALIAVTAGLLAGLLVAMGVLVRHYRHDRGAPRADR